MVEVGALPSLRDRSVQEWIRLVWPNTFDKPRRVVLIVVEDWVEWLWTADLDLAVCAAGDLDDEIDDLLVAVLGVERDVVPEGDWFAVVLEPDSPFLRVLEGTRSCQGSIYTRVFGAPTVLRLRAS